MYIYIVHAFVPILQCTLERYIYMKTDEARQDYFKDH